MRYAALAVLIVSSPALADPPVVRISQEVRQQICQGGQCRIEQSTHWGTGTIVGRDSRGRVLVLTCGHGWSSQAPTVDIWFGPGDHRTGQILSRRTDRDVDVGLIAFGQKGDIAVCNLSEKAPSRGDALTAAGWGAGKLVESCVDCEGYFGKATLVTSKTFRQGDSGGPILWDGKLVGIINGNMGQQGVGTSVKAIREFLKPWPIEEVDAPPIPGPPPEKLEPVPVGATISPEFTAIMRRLDRIEHRLDLLSSPKVPQ